MTRKRYVKLLMAYGCPRNLAQARAAIDLFKYGRYTRAFVALGPYLRARGALHDMCARVVSAWMAVDPRLRRTVQDIVSAMEVAHE